MIYDHFLFAVYQLLGKVQRPYMDVWEVDFFRDLVCFVSPKRVRTLCESQPRVNYRIRKVQQTQETNVRHQTVPTRQ